MGGVIIPRVELEGLLEEVNQLMDTIDELTAKRHALDTKTHSKLAELLRLAAERRVNVSMIKTRLEQLLKVRGEEPDETPRRPPSQQAMKAFEASSEFDPTKREE